MWVWLVLLALVLLVAYWLISFNKKLQTDPPVGPQPPEITGSIPFIRAGLDFVKNPKEFLNAMRKKHGDVFVLHAFGIKLFFVFSGPGLREFYKITEADASFQEATRGFLGLKVPDEILQGSMKKIYKVLNRDLMKSYISRFHKTMDEVIEGMGKDGNIDVFVTLKRVLHRVGFHSWAGEEAASSKYFDRMIANFEQIDPETGFKDMSSVFLTLITKKSKEKKAFNDVVKILKEIYKNRKEKEDDMLEALHELYSSSAEETRYRQVAADVMVLHMASQANLYAAISWTLINLLQHKEYLTEVVDTNRQLRAEHGDDYLRDTKVLDQMELLDQCFNESIRLAQQSLTLRLVRKPVKFESEGYTVVPGYYIATLLSCTNCDESIIKDGESFNPRLHYQNGKLVTEGPITPGCESSVSAFGHGTHFCPGKKFANMAVKIILCKLLDSFTFTPKFEQPVEILKTSMGAVGRPVNPVNVHYERKRD